MHKDDHAGEFLIHDYYVSNAKLSAEWTLAGVTPLHITHKIRVWFNEADSSDIQCGNQSDV